MLTHTRILLCSVLLFAAGGSICGNPSEPVTVPRPVATDHSLDVPYYHQDDYQAYHPWLCIPACIQMWTAWAHPDRAVPTQDQIATDMYYNCAGVAWGWSITYNAAACGVNRHVFDNGACVSCEDPIQARELTTENATKAAAYNVDQLNEPTMDFINYKQHSVLFVGGYYGPDGILGNLVAYQAYYHDPIAGARIPIAVNSWLDTLAAGTGTAYQVGHYYDDGVQRLTEIFDYFGGTYYGDPAPPECDPSVPHNCEPLEADALTPHLFGGVTNTFAGLLHNPVGAARMTATMALARMPEARAGALPSFRQALRGAVPRRWIRKPVGPGWANHGMRRSIYVPHPYSGEREDIIDNCLTGLRQAKFDIHPDLAPLVHDPSITVSDIRHVHSLIGTEDYSLLTFVNREDRPYAVASVSDTGWLKEATKLSDGQGVPTDAQILARAAQFGFPAVDGPNWVLMISSAIGCGGSLTPVAAMRTHGGRWLLMNMQRQLYVEDDQGPIVVTTKLGGRITLRAVTGQ